MNDTQVVIQTGNWKVKVILGLGGLATLVIFAFLYRAEIGLIILILGAIGAIRLGFWARARYTLERLQERQLKAHTQQAEAEARMAHWRMRQEQATAQKLAYDALFIERKAGTFVIGDMPFKFYPTATASAQLATQPALALPAGPLDFFQAMSNNEQVFAIVGPQRIGKSILAQHLAQYLAQRGRICVVIGTKARPGEWLNCRRFIGNEAVPGALASILAETRERLAGNRTTPPLCVFLDDWLNSCVLDGDIAEQFFVEAATRMLTAGIVPYFLLQSDSKADYGTRKGAQLKNNFVHLYLIAPRDQAGNLDRDRLKGWIIYAGDREPHAVNLPAGLPVLGDGQPDIELAEPEEPEPTEQERRILELAENGVSLNQIAREIYGSAGGKQYDAIRVILAKYGRNE